jgi:hypothetical protein
MPVSKTILDAYSNGSDGAHLSCLQAYHSALNESEDARRVGNMSILPIKTKVRGPAPVGTSQDVEHQP